MDKFSRPDYVNIFPQTNEDHSNISTLPPSAAFQMNAKEYHQSPTYKIDSFDECFVSPTLFPAIRWAANKFSGGEYEIIKRFPIHRGLLEFPLGKYNADAPLEDIISAVQALERYITPPPPPSYPDPQTSLF